jgi:CBS domain-containing protein
MTDLFRTFESGAKIDTPVAEFMVKDPVAISTDDTSLVAVTTLRDYRLKWIPVVDEKEDRRILGYISARKIMAYVFKETRVLS